MKAFIERVFMAKKNKKEQELIDETITTEVTEQATEASIKAIKEVKHDLNSCGCHECELARDQGAK